MWRVLIAAAAVLEEANRSPLDEAGGQRLAEAHHRLLVEAGSEISDDLLQELQHLVAPFERHDLTTQEARLAQAQLVGWLTGLMEGLRTGLVGVKQQPVG